MSIEFVADDEREVQYAGILPGNLLRIVSQHIYSLQPTENCKWLEHVRITHGVTSIKAFISIYTHFDRFRFSEIQKSMNVLCCRKMF